MLVLAFVFSAKPIEIKAISIYITKKRQFAKLNITKMVRLNFYTYFLVILVLASSSSTLSYAKITEFNSLRDCLKSFLYSLDAISFCSKLVSRGAT